MYLDAEDAERLRAVAEREDRSVTSIFRIVIREFLAAQDEREAA